MNNSERIADQLRRAFEGEAWHGPALRELLSGVSAQQAASRPLPDAHSIWELVLHIDAWQRFAQKALEGDGKAMPVTPRADQDWPPVRDTGDAAWQQAVEQLISFNARFCQQIARLNDNRLIQIVPGRRYDFYFLFNGLAQHALYHGGQIALLKKALAEEPRAARQV